jgi:hypothetical protein
LEKTVRRLAAVLAVPALSLALLTVGATNASADGSTTTTTVMQLMHPPKCC